MKKIIDLLEDGNFEEFSREETKEGLTTIYGRVLWKSIYFSASISVYIDPETGGWDGGWILVPEIQDPDEDISLQRGVEGLKENFPSLEDFIEVVECTSYEELLPYIEKYYKEV